MCMLGSKSSRSCKGQVGLIDVLLLGFFISVSLILGMYMGEGQVQAEITKEEAGYAQSMLLAVMNYKNSTYGSYSNIHNLSLAEAIDLYACTGKISREDLESTLKYLLGRMVKSGYNYIFYFYVVGYGEKELWVYNKQKKVCAKYIPLKTFDLKLSCNTYNYTLPKLGIWPEWKELPEECE